MMCIVWMGMTTALPVKPCRVPNGFCKGESGKKANSVPTKDSISLVKNRTAVCHFAITGEEYQSVRVLRIATAVSPFFH